MQEDFDGVLEGASLFASRLAFPPLTSHLIAVLAVGLRGPAWVVAQNVSGILLSLHQCGTDLTFLSLP